MMAVMLPELFIDRLTKIVPDHWHKTVIESFSKNKPTIFRVNILKADIDLTIQAMQQESFVIEKISWLENAFSIPKEQRELLTHSHWVTKGLVYIQSLSSMLAPLLLEPKPGEEILDLASAPGSKTSQIAALMGNQGRIAAVEKSKPRFFKLKSNLAILGVNIVDTYLKDGGLVGKQVPNRFDRVLLDAPCSSEGRFKTSDESSWQFWSDKKIRQMSKTQWQLIVSAYHALKPGGVLLYSTCTFSPEENEAIINRLIKKFGDKIAIAPLELPINNIMPGLTSWEGKAFHDDVKNAVRILPNEIMDGFFLAKIIKK